MRVTEDKTTAVNAVTNAADGAPLISVIIPVYNGAKTILPCLRSVLRQELPGGAELEIIAVDDGSTDGTDVLLRRAASRDARVRPVFQENAGTAAARNAGLELARGKYLAFADADDRLGRGYLRGLAETAEEAQAEVTLTGLTMCDEAGRVLRRLVPEADHAAEWLMRISAVCSHLYRRDFRERFAIRFTEGERGEDMPVSLLSAALAQRTAVHPASGYYYVQHADSARHTFRGLRSHSLPYRGLTETFEKVEAWKSGEGRDAWTREKQENYELFALRILATCYFDLGRGADAAQMEELTAFIRESAARYLPGIAGNGRLGVLSEGHFPVSQKAAVSLLRALVLHDGLDACGKVLERL